jgi:iron complex outermembrane receptor protein
MYSIGGDFTYKIATLTLTGRYMDKVYNNDENLDKEEGVYGAYDSFFVADMNLRVRVTDYATVNFAIDNMFDEKYYSYYLAPGRTFFGGLTLKF